MHYPGASSSSSSAQQPFPLPSQSQNQQIQYQPPYRDFLPPAAMQFGHPGYAQNLQPGQPYPFPPVGVDQTAFPLSHQKMTASTSQLQQLSQQHSHYPKAYPFAPAQMYHQPSPSTSTFGQNPPHPPAGAQPPLRLQAFPPPMSSLLAYLFSPTEVTTAELGYTDQTLVGHEGGKNELFDEPPSLAHRDLMVEALRMEVANDLIESYFQVRARPVSPLELRTFAHAGRCHSQIVHIRMPLLAQSVFKSEFESSQASHVKLAVVLALGAKFSEHPIIVMDRDQTSDPTVTVSINGSPVTKRTSRLVRLLVARAQQVLEVHRAYRSPTIDNIQACLLMEGLLNRPCNFLCSPLACSCEGKNRLTLVFRFWRRFQPNPPSRRLAETCPRTRKDSGRPWPSATCSSCVATTCRRSSPSRTNSAGAACSLPGGSPA